MCTFDFDLPNITSIDRRTVLCFTCWGKHLLRPSWKSRHKPPLHYPGFCWQACDDESSMVCWDLTLITAVIYWQLPYPLTTAITSWVIVVHRAGIPVLSSCICVVYTLWSYMQRSLCSENSYLFFLCLFKQFLIITNFSWQLNLSFLLVFIFNLTFFLSPGILIKTEWPLVPTSEARFSDYIVVRVILRISRVMSKSEQQLFIHNFRKMQKKHLLRNLIRLACDGGISVSVEGGWHQYVTFSISCGSPVALTWFI